MSYIIHVFKEYKYMIRNSDKFWYVDNKSHRINGPAVECPDGFKEWYRNGQYHREDGPAIEWPNACRKEWWLNGKIYSETEFNEIIKK